MEKEKKYAEIHLHSRDLFDSDNQPKRVCARLKELGAKGLVLTQHGTLSGIEPMRAAAAAAGLKFVPGIETYYGEESDLKQNKHLLLIAMDDAGYKAIWKAVSDSQNSSGYSVMNQKILMQYFAEGSEGHGHVIATSACIGGVIADKILVNEIVYREVEKTEKSMEKYFVDADVMKEATDRMSAVEADLKRLYEESDAAKLVAGQRFAKREKEAEKQAKLDPEKGRLLKEKLEKDKADAQNAKHMLERLRAEINAAKKARTGISHDLAALYERQARYGFYLKKKDELLAGCMSETDAYAEAVKEAKRFEEIFGKGNFYMEVQNHGLEKEAVVYPKIARIARELSMPLVATNDVHIIEPTEEELRRRQILNAMRFGDWEEVSDGDKELYIKTDDELAKWLSRILPEDVVLDAMKGIRELFDRCNVEFKTESHYPVFPSEHGKSSRQMFLEAIREGAKWRFPEGLDQEHKDRINYEFRVITQMGYTDYHLIVKDYLEYGRILAPVPENRIDEAPLTIPEAKEWVKKNGWVGGFSIGPGRGSAVGSEICYLLGITNLDPLKYGLLFERFLNPERVSMPDIDSDFSFKVRGRCMDYVKHKYGQDAVCSIMTTNAQAPKGAIRIAAKYYGLSLDREGAFLTLGDTIAKKVPAEVGTSFASPYGKGEDVLTVYEALQKEFAGNKDALVILNWAKAVEGCFTSYGAHAAGVVISDGAPVKEYVPLRWNSNINGWTTQVDKEEVEEKGLIKMDFLGLRTLDIITDALLLIYQRTGKLIDPLLDIPMDDTDVFRHIFQKANTNSVFQFESSGMKAMLRRFKPETFDDLIILVSMYRPGPMQYIDGVIQVKSGEKPMTFLTSELEPILGKTYGAIVYQEQVMEIFQKLAGYTLGGADQVRRFMSKKKTDKLLHEKEAFIYGDSTRGIDGCVAKGIDAASAQTLFGEMTDFAKYAFNKSHAAAYAANAYYTAWLKYHYPAEFLASAMNWAADVKKLSGLIKEAKTFRVDVLPPDINTSSEKFTVTASGEIRYALSAIRSVGASSSEIVKIRDGGEHGRIAFESFYDFLEKTNMKKDVVQNLAMAGAFDAFSKNREALLASVEPFKAHIAKVVKQKESVERARGRLLEVGLDAKKKQAAIEKLRAEVKKLENREAERAEQTVCDDGKEDVQNRMLNEKRLLGAYITAHPMNDYPNCEDVGAVPIRDLSNGRVKILGVITEVEVKYTKKDKRPMAFLTVEDLSGEMTVNVFPDAYAKVKDKITEGRVALFIGNAKEEQSFMTDEDGNPVVEMKLNVQDMKTVLPGRKKYLASIRSEKEAALTKVYLMRFRSENGYPISIQVFETNRVEKLDFPVSSKVESVQGVYIV